MHCDHCDSTNTVQIAAIPDDSVVGGVVRLYVCGDCLQTTEDVPPEKVDAMRDTCAAAG